MIQPLIFGLWMILGSFPVFFFEKPDLSLGSFDCMFLENEHTHTDIYIYIHVCRDRLWITYNLATFSNLKGLDRYGGR